MKTIRRQQKEKIESSKRQKGIIRKEHFSNGGTLEEWRGTHKIFSDSKKDESKFLCRDPYVSSEEEFVGPDEDWSNHMGEE